MDTFLFGLWPVPVSFAWILPKADLWQPVRDWAVRQCWLLTPLTFLSAAQLFPPPDVALKTLRKLLCEVAHWVLRFRDLPWKLISNKRRQDSRRLTWGVFLQSSAVWAQHSRRKVHKYENSCLLRASGRSAIVSSIPAYCFSYLFKGTCLQVELRERKVQKLPSMQALNVPRGIALYRAEWGQRSRPCMYAIAARGNYDGNDAIWSCSVQRRSRGVVRLSLSKLWKPNILTHPYLEVRSGN